MDPGQMYDNNPAPFSFPSVGTVSSNQTDMVYPNRLLPGVVPGSANLGVNGFGLYVDTQDQRIVVNDGTNDRVLIGQRLDGTFGIDVSQVGSSVKTASNSQLVMSSKFNMLKIVQKATQTLNVVAATIAANGFQIFSFAHGQSVRPAMQAYMIGNNTTNVSYQTTGSFPLPWVGYSYDAVGPGDNILAPFVQLETYIDDTNINFRVWDIYAIAGGSLFATQYTVQYYIFVESL